MPVFHKGSEDEPRPAEVKAAAQPASAKVESSLGLASESGDPAVQQLLAELNIADSNNDKAAAQAIRDRITSLGFAV